MTLNEFHLLSNTEQTHLLREQGVYIGKQKEAGKTLVLYQLDSFYVEIFYTKYRHSITHFNCFTSTEQLNPYLKQVDVEDLIRCVS